jgi:hypothetical protein
MGEVIRAGQIKDYMTPAAYKAIEYYHMAKTFGGNPNGNIGWVNEPFSFVSAFLAFEQEEATIQAEDRAKREAESKAKQHSGKSGKHGSKARRRR